MHKLGMERGVGAYSRFAMHQVSASDERSCGHGVWEGKASLFERSLVLAVEVPELVAIPVQPILLLVPWPRVGDDARLAQPDAESLLGHIWVANVHDDVDLHTLDGPVLPYAHAVSVVDGELHVAKRQLTALSRVRQVERDAVDKVD